MHHGITRICTWTTLLIIGLFTSVNMALAATPADTNTSDYNGGTTTTGMVFHITAAPKTGVTFNSIVVSIINIALFAAGAAAALYMIYGGFTYVTAGGDDQKTTDARKMIVNAIIGMLAVAAVYLIFGATLNTANKFAAGQVTNTADGSSEL